MDRVEIIQKIINKTKAGAYFEIGVDSGECFLKIKAKQKIAVDPSFSIKKLKKIIWQILNPSNAAAEYYELTSDDFFAKNASRHLGLDLAFIDGLHTYQQSLKDFNNSLKHLNKKGVIVMHDCNPPTESSAYPAKSLTHAGSLNLPGWTGEWCGDVWKTICYLRAFNKDLNVFVLDCDYGVGIITRRTPESNLSLTEKELDNFTYNDLARNREDLLNLKNAEFLYEFLDSL